MALSLDDWYQGKDAMNVVGVHETNQWTMIFNKIKNLATNMPAVLQAAIPAIAIV